MLHAIFRHTTALQQSYLHVRLLDLKKNAPCLSIFHSGLPPLGVLYASSIGGLLCVFVSASVVCCVAVLPCCVFERKKKSFYRDG